MVEQLPGMWEVPGLRSHTKGGGEARAEWREEEMGGVRRGGGERD